MGLFRQPPQPQQRRRTNVPAVNTYVAAEAASGPVVSIQGTPLADTTNPGIEQAVLDQNSLSSDDVLTIVVERGNRENK